MHAQAKVLITGGAGVIGSAVCRELLQYGLRPVIYDLRPDCSLIADIRSEVDFVSGSVTDLRALVRTVRGHNISRIVHLAAVIFAAAQDDPFLGYEVNAFGTLNVFEAAQLCSCERVVFMSSRAVFAPVTDRHGHPEYRPIDEDYPKGPSEVYGASKLAVEYMAQSYQRRYGMQLIGLRFSSMYGPGRLARHGVVAHTSRLVESAMAACPEHLPAGGDQCDDFLYVGDAARALRLAVTADTVESGIYNVGSGTVSSLKDFIDALKLVFPAADVSVGDGLDFQGTGRQRYCSLDITRARQSLGYEPAYDVRRGIVDYVDTLRRLNLKPLSS